MPNDELRLLSLDGGGVRGLSSLYILKNILEKVAGPGNPLPRPCEYFDMIGGTSTGGLIAIMLGRLGLTVDECIDAYVQLSKEVFGKKRSLSRINYKLEISTQFDSKKLEDVIKRFPGAADLLASPAAADSKCKVIVCAVRKSNSQPALLRSYRSMRSNEFAPHMTVWEACRATSAAPGFFDPIAVGPNRQELIDGGLGYNNPVDTVYTEARDIWGPTDAQLQDRVVCFVSIGTGVPKLKTMEPGLRHTLKTLSKIVSDTQTTENRFRRDKAEFVSRKRYFRFNVDNGLQGIGLEEHHKQSIIADATSTYLDRPDVHQELMTCAGKLSSVIGLSTQTPSSVGQSHPISTCSDKFRIDFSLAGVPFADKFVGRPKDMEVIMSNLLPSIGNAQEQGRRIHVLQGIGGVGKTQLAANFFTRFGKQFSAAFWLRANTRGDLRRSLVKCSRRIWSGEMTGLNQHGAPENPEDEQFIVEEMLNWLGKEENKNWLLVFDNVDLDSELQADREAGAYEIFDYLQANHGSVLITTRLHKLTQLTGSGHGDVSLGTVDLAMSQQIFLKWFGSSDLRSLGTNATEAINDLVGPGMLGGLPLAIAQAAVYIRKQRISVETYQRLYEEMWHHVMGVPEGRTPIQGYHKSVATTWSLSLQQAEQTNPHAGSLVRMWAFLDGKDMWHGLLSEPEAPLFSRYAEGMTTEEWNKTYGPTERSCWLRAVQKEADFLECMGTLLEFGLIEQQHREETDIDDQHNGGVEQSFAMHPVVHAWSMQMQSEEDKVRSLGDALQLFSLELDMNDCPWAWKQRWLPHAVKLYTWTMETSCKSEKNTPAWTSNLGAVDGMIGICCHLIFASMLEDSARGLRFLLENWIRCEFSEEVGTGRAPQKHDERKFVPWAMICQAILIHSVALAKSGQLASAEANSKTAIDLSTRAGGQSHELTLQAMNHLAARYRFQGELRKAEAILQEVSKLLEAELSTDRHLSVEYLVMQNAFQLGCIYKASDRPDEAEAKFRQALSDASRQSDLWLQSVASEKLGDLYSEQGRHEYAEPLLQKAWESVGENFGDDDWQTAQRAASLAWVYAARNKTQDAQNMLDRAFSSARPLSVSRALQSVAIGELSTRRRGEDVSQYEPLLRRAWDEALRILRAKRYTELPKEDIRSLYYSYADLRRLYMEKGRQADVENLDHQMSGFDLSFAESDNESATQSSEGVEEPDGNAQEELRTE